MQLYKAKRKKREIKQAIIRCAYTVTLILALSGILCSCNSYIFDNAGLLFPEQEDFQTVETGESSVAGGKSDDSTEPTAQLDINAVLSMIKPKTDVTKIMADTDGTGISGKMYYTIESAELFSNLYEAGFRDDQIGYWGESAFPYQGSIDFDEQVFDRDSGALSSNMGLLRIKLTVNNENAVNHNSERDYDDGTLFDIREFYLSDFSLLDCFDKEDGMQCSHPMLFSGYQACQEGAFFYRLSPGESQSFCLGFLVDLSTFSIDTAFLTSVSYFTIPDDLPNITFYTLPEATGEK